MAWFGGGMLKFDLAFNPAPLMVMFNDTLASRVRQCMEVGTETAKSNLQILTHPSLPWEYPRNVTYKLHDSIDWRVFDEGNSIIGDFGVLVEMSGDVNMAYASYLETGTKRMEPRPWLTLTLAEVWKRWGEILGGSGVDTFASTEARWQSAGPRP